MSGIERFILFFAVAAAALFIHAAVSGPDSGSYLILPAGTDPEAAFEQYPDADYIMIPKGGHPPQTSENVIVRSYWSYPLRLVLYDFLIYGLTVLVLSADMHGLALFLKSAAAHLCGRPAGPESRAHLLEYIRNHPGCSTREIIDATGVKRGTLRYHAIIIMKQNGIRRVLFENEYHYFSKNVFQSEAHCLLTLHCRSRMRRQIYETICRTPGISGRELAEETDICKTSVRHHTKRLSDDFLIETRKSGASFRFYPLPAGPDGSLSVFKTEADPKADSPE